MPLHCCRFIEFFKTYCKEQYLSFAKRQKKGRRAMEGVTLLQKRMIQAFLFYIKDYLL